MNSFGSALPLGSNALRIAGIDFSRLCLGVFLLLQLLTGAQANVKLLITMREPYLDVTCEVSNTKRTIYLFCPLLGNQIVSCFQGCVASCMKPDCSDHPAMRDITCREQKIGNSRIVTYTVNHRNEANKGKWTCGVGNERSSPFILTPPKAKPPPPPTRAPVIVPPVVTEVKPPPKKPPVTGDIGWRGGVTIVKPGPHDSKDIYDIVPRESTPKPDSKLGFWLDLTSPTLVIAVLILLGLSLIVNIAFCIRCILVKKYIDKYRRGVTDTSCLEGCLCIPKARVRGFFKDDLYEDISSTPRVVYSPGGSSKSAMGVEREDSLEFHSLARSRAYSPTSHPSQNPMQRVSDIYATVKRDPRDPRRSSAAGRYYSPQPPSAASQRVYDDVPESRSLTEIYTRPQRPRMNGSNGGGGSTHSSNLSASASGSSPRHSPDSTGTPSTIALKRVSEHPIEEEAAQDDPGVAGVAGELIEECTRNDTRLELSKTLLNRADTLLREAGTLLD